jgi:hypothetical protein
MIIPGFHTPTYLVSAALLNAGATFLSRTHMANFWNDTQQTRIPFVEKFNEAIRGSEKVVLLLGTLSISWATAAAVWVGTGNGILGLAVWGVVVGGRVWSIRGELGWSGSGMSTGSKKDS